LLNILFGRHFVEFLSYYCVILSTNKGVKYNKPGACFM